MMAPGRHLDLAAAGLNDCKHLYRLLDGGGKTLDYQIPAGV